MSHRPNLYSNPHKAIRSLLAELMSAVGRTDVSATSELCALRSRFDAVVALLEKHAHKEDEFAMPLLHAHAPGIAEELERAHTTQHEQLHALATELREIEASPTTEAQQRLNRFGVALARVIGELLTHMSDEEERAMPALWARMGDLELLEVELRLIASTPREQLDQWIVIMFPAISPIERAEMLASMRATAPAPAFQSALSLISRVLPPRDYSRLLHDLGERSAA